MELKKLVVTCLCLMSGPALLHSQDLTTAIFGFVTNAATGEGVSGVLVEAINEAVWDQAG